MIAVHLSCCALPALTCLSIWLVGLKIGIVLRRRNKAFASVQIEYVRILRGIAKLFLDASLHLNKRVCPSISPWSVFFFSANEGFSFRSLIRIFSSYWINSLLTANDVSVVLAEDILNSFDKPLYAMWLHFAAQDMINMLLPNGVRTSSGNDAPTSLDASYSLNNLKLLCTAAFA